jgi:hypothetical protein
MDPRLEDAAINAVTPQFQPPQAEQSRLAMVWSKHSKPATTFQRYKKTCVLMLHWEDSDWKDKLKAEVSNPILLPSTKID